MAMAKSFYKAPSIGKTPMCAIRGGDGEGPRAKHFPTYGVSVWLCEALEQRRVPASTGWAGPRRELERGMERRGNPGEASLCRAGDTPEADSIVGLS
jgi:hypothetical protein